MIEENIEKIIKELQSDVSQALEKISKDVAKEGIAKLKSDSPKRSGTYAKGWGQTKNKDSIIINNKKRGNITHLLEKGHVKRNGGRVAPRKHIEPVDEWIQKELVSRIEKELE